MANWPGLCYCAPILPLGIPQFKASGPCDLSIRPVRGRHPDNGAWP